MSEQAFLLAPSSEWYVLESYVPNNASHRPKYKIVNADSISAYSKKINATRKRDSKSRVYWRIIGGLQPSEQEAEAMLNAHRGLRCFTEAHLFAARPPAPVVAMECGCVVSKDKRRVKHCVEAKRLIDGLARAKAAWVTLLNSWQYERVDAAQTALKFHTISAEMELP